MGSCSFLSCGWGTSLRSQQWEEVGKTSELSSLFLRIPVSQRSGKRKSTVWGIVQLPAPERKENERRARAHWQRSRRVKVKRLSSSGEFCPRAVPCNYLQLRNEPHPVVILSTLGPVQKHIGQQVLSTHLYSKGEPEKSWLSGNSVQK